MKEINHEQCYFSLFRSLPMLFDLFDIIFHYKVVNMKSFISWPINSRNGQVKNTKLEERKRSLFVHSGIGKTEEIDRLHVNPYDGTIVHYHDPITAFPEKIDQLLIALNKVTAIIEFSPRYLC
jgi:hypothetical protein